jgi:hypothetical protein
MTGPVCPKDGTPLVCPACAGSKGGRTTTPARLEALKAARAARWPKTTKKK